MAAASFARSCWRGSLLKGKLTRFLYARGELCHKSGNLHVWKPAVPSQNISDISERYGYRRRHLKSKSVLWFCNLRPVKITPNLPNHYGKTLRLTKIPKILTHEIIVGWSPTLNQVVLCETKEAVRSVNKTNKYYLIQTFTTSTENNEVGVLVWCVRLDDFNSRTASTKCT